MTNFKIVLPYIGMGNRDYKFNKKFSISFFINRRKGLSIRLLRSDIDIGKTNTVYVYLCRLCRIYSSK